MKSITCFKKTHQLNILIIGFLVLLAATSTNKYLLKKPVLVFSREDHSINFNSSVNYIHFGLKRFYTSILWINTLLDSDLDRNFNKNKNSWMYYRFLTISELDSKFLENYQWGGQYLSIIKDDLLGAECIYKKGVLNYPDDYFLNFNLAFLYFNELKDAKASLPYLLRIKDNPKTPKYILSLIATLMQKSNVDIQTIIEFTNDAYRNNIDPIYADIFERKLKQLNLLKSKNKQK